MPVALLLVNWHPWLVLKISGCHVEAAGPHEWEATGQLFDKSASRLVGV